MAIPPDGRSAKVSSFRVQARPTSLTPVKVVVFGRYSVLVVCEGAGAAGCGKVETPTLVRQLGRGMRLQSEEPYRKTGLAESETPRAV
jgi:hypothetical protein